MTPAIVERPPTDALFTVLDIDRYAAAQAQAALDGMRTFDEQQQAVQAALHGAWTDFRDLIADAVSEAREDAVREAQEDRADVR